MTAEIVTLNCETVLPIEPDRVLTAAQAAGLSDVLVVGRDAEGELYVAASAPDAGALLVMLEAAKRQVLDAVL